MGLAIRALLTLGIVAALGITTAFFGQTDNIAGQIGLALLLSLGGTVFLLRILRRSKLR